MDTSEQYIKMCSCPEIQDLWLKKAGDWVSYVCQPALRNDPFGLKRQEKRIHVYGTNDKIDKNIDLVPHNAIWLPRLDQILEFIRDQYRFPSDILHMRQKWFKCISISVGSPDDTWEKMLLCLFMDAKKNKVWDEKSGWMPWKKPPNIDESIGPVAKKMVIRA